MTEIDAISAARLAPINPAAPISGTIMIIKTNRLANVTIDTYSCFLMPKNNAEVEPEIPRITPNTIKILRNGTIVNHFSPNIRPTTCSAKIMKVDPNKRLETLTTASVLKNALFKRLRSLAILAYTGNVTFATTSDISVIGSIEILYAIW